MLNSPKSFSSLTELRNPLQESTHEKENLLCCKKTSNSARHKSFKSLSGLSFLTSAITYFVKVIGSASQLKEMYKANCNVTFRLPNGIITSRTTFLKLVTSNVLLTNFISIFKAHLFCGVKCLIDYSVLNNDV